MVRRFWTAEIVYRRVFENLRNVELHDEQWRLSYDESQRCLHELLCWDETLNVQGSKSEIIGQELLQFASTGSEEKSHFAASNMQTNFVSDDDHEQQEGVEDHETLTADEITEDLNAHTKCSRGIEAAIHDFRLEVAKLRLEFAELSNLSTARRSDETRLHNENRDLKQKLPELEMQYYSLKHESRAIQDENKSLLNLVDY